MLDWEGEAVAEYAVYDGSDLAEIGAHYGIILNMIAKVLVGGTSGDVVLDIGIATRSSRLVISTIKEGYYLVLKMEKDVPFGRILFKTRKTISLLKDEMR